MKVQSGRYKLVVEDILDGSKEVFDFKDDTRNFVGENEVVDSVSVASIDALTASFPNLKYLYGYLNKENYKTREDFSKKSYISYNHLVTKEEAMLDTVWDDPVLAEIAEHTNGGKVDFTNETTKHVFDTLYSELISRESKFGTNLLVTSNNTHHVNDYNKSLLKKCVFETSAYDSFLQRKIRGSFSSYREFRALYLSYINYVKNVEKKDGFSFSKK